MKVVFLDAGTITPITHCPIDVEKLSLEHFDVDMSALTKLNHDVIFFNRTQPSEVLSRCTDADIIITNKVNLNRQLLEQLKQTKLICVSATGVNNIDLAAAEENKIGVCNVAGYSTNSVAQITFHLLLQLTNRISELKNQLSRKSWADHPHFSVLATQFHELSGKTFGVIGYGEIGRAVSNIARAFGMKLLIAQLPNRPSAPYRLPLNSFLPQCDVVSLHCPETEETKQLVNQEFLGRMKPKALLLNTARGGLIDETALAHALQQGTIAGAGIDVLSQEPPSADNPLLSAKNCIVTPHIGWTSVEARQTLVNEIAENIAAFHDNNKRNRLV
ncbi:MAG: D-2-hydroxyacid dehydrogenase [Gammaproteobacteria bacterium]|nr:D-2-hydroxyacid dehydrogenase [Gammaproteobacteria bacterium]